MNQKKIAQQLARRHKARRMVNLTGAGLAALHPTFRKYIKNLDRVDKKVRKEAEDLNYLIGMAHSFARRRDYLSCATYLTKFHKKVRQIHYDLNSFMGGISPKTKRFMLGQGKGKDKELLFGYNPTEEFNKADDGLVTTAAGELKKIKDWWKTPGRFSDLAHRLTDRKSKAMKALENSFSDPFFEKFKEDTNEMLNTTDDVYKQLLESFHNMGSAWARRNLKEYNNEIIGINSYFDPYHKQYVKYYEENIVPIKKEQEQVNKEEQDLKEKEALKASPALEVSAPIQPSKDDSPISSVSPSSRESVHSYKSDAPGSSFSPAPGSFRPESVKPSPTMRSRVEDISATKQESAEEIPLVVRKGPVVVNRGEEAITPKRHSLPATKPQPQPGTQKFPFYTSDKVKPYKLENVPSLRNLGTPTLRGLNPPAKIDNDDEEAKTMNSAQLTGVLKELNRKSNEDFLNRIEKLSTEEEIIKEILSYSEEVEKYSEDESLKLLSIAEGLIEKKAGDFFDKVKKSIRGPKLKEEPKEEAPKRVHRKKQPVAVIEEPKDEPKSMVIEDPTPTSRMTEGGPAPVTLRGPKSEMIEQETDVLPPPSRGRLDPVDHGIPEGEVNKLWNQIPFLSNIGKEEVKLSPVAANQIIVSVAHRLNHIAPELRKSVDNFGNKFIHEFKKSIFNGKVLSNMACNDRHNPRDCYLEIYSGFRINKLNPSLDGSTFITYNIICRLSINSGEVIINSIKNIKIVKQ